MPILIGVENKRENFKRIAEARTSRIIDSIHALRNFTNTSFYDYSDEEIEAVFSAIQKEVDETRSVFEKQKGKEKRFKL